MNCLSHKASFYFTAKHKNITSWRIKGMILFRADHIKWQSMIGFETKKWKKVAFEVIDVLSQRERSLRV